MRAANAIKILSIAVAILATVCSAVPMKRRDEVTSALRCRARKSSSSFTSAAPALSNITSSAPPESTIDPTISPSASTNTSSLQPTPTPTPTPIPPNPYTFNIEISNQRQHMGDWSDTGYMRSDLKYVLTMRCDKKKWGAATCDDLRPYTYTGNEYTIAGNVVEKGTVGTNVSVTSAYVPEGYHEELQEAFIEQVLDTIMIAVGTDTPNCYVFDRSSTICAKTFGTCALFCSVPPDQKMTDHRGIKLSWCNAPEYVRVSLVNNEAKEEIAHMRVDLKFLGETDKGRFDCVAVIDAVDKNARDKRQKGLVEVVGGKEVETVVACSSREVTGSCPNPGCLYQLGKCFE